MLENLHGRNHVKSLIDIRQAIDPEVYYQSKSVRALSTYGKSLVRGIDPSYNGPMLK